MFPFFCTPQYLKADSSSLWIMSHPWMSPGQTGLLDQAMRLHPYRVWEERQIWWRCHTEHLFIRYITFNEAAVSCWVRDRAALCWGWRGESWPVIPASLLASFYHARRLMWLQMKDTHRILMLFSATAADLCPATSMDPKALKLATVAAEILFLHFMTNGLLWKHF